MNSEGHMSHDPLPGGRAVAGEGPLKGVSWLGLKIVAGLGASLGETGQGLRYGSLEGITMSS